MQLTSTQQTRARVLEVQRCSVHDGPGIRTTVFLAGCNLRCAWCHNPEAFAGARGELRSVEEVLAEVLADSAFYQESGGGLTVSGGEPLLQPAFLRELLLAAKGAGVHTCVQTAAAVPTAVLLELASLADLVQIDLKHLDGERHRAITGRDNALVLVNLAALVERGARIQVRMPVVPGWNDDEENLERVAALLTRHRVSALRLVPYQRGYLHKYRELALRARCAEVVPPSRARLHAIAERFSHSGISTVIDA